MTSPHVVVPRVNIVPHLKVFKVTSSEMPNSLFFIGVKILVYNFIWLLEDRGGRARIIVILPIQLRLPQAEVKALLLKVRIRFLAFVGPFHHLLSIAQTSLPGRLEGGGLWDEPTYLSWPATFAVLLLVGVRLRLGWSKHVVVALVRHTRVQEPTVGTPRALPLVEEPAYSLGFLSQEGVIVIIVTQLSVFSVLGINLSLPLLSLLSFLSLLPLLLSTLSFRLKIQLIF